MQTTVQLSLDLIDLPEALQTAETAIRAGVDWLEAGTPLILAEGVHGVRALREAHPNIPIVADLKIMDGGYLEAELMAKAGATYVVVMGQAHSETIELVVKAVTTSGSRSWATTWPCPTLSPALESWKIWGATTSFITSATICALCDDSAVKRSCRSTVFVKL